MAMLGKQTTITFGPLLGTEIKPLCVAALGDMSFTATQTDATCYGKSLYRKYIPGLKEPGAMDITVNYNSNDEGIETLYESFISGSTLVYIVRWPDGSTWKFDGVITGYSATTPLDDKIQQTFSVQISGEPVYTAAPVPQNVVVSFHANGGSGTMESVSVPTATPYSVPQNTFTAPAGKQFVRWIDGNAVTYEPSDTINLRHDTDLTAEWEDAA